ncbi:DUF1285 domain-containing protein [Brucella grignonensis]|uniref:DUF1285 domain-containing protein n=1 Tax=Brucella grignonensis TaxID=94627 RepID=A0A256FG04_9HYPH|nr:DUF1285 domain-containing protein [Brucella grignonensis]OYR13802.1 hypothetical protein CEV33_0600 [Brucella grignonensis]
MTKSTPNGKHEPQSSMKAGASASGLEALIARAHADSHSGPATKEREIPPVERWNPEFCGDLDMEIRADGTWFYMGTPIGRPQLVRLFSTVLRKDEDGKTYLVTPVEKVGIRVEDAHFIAVEMQVSGEGNTQTLTFRTNVGDVIEAGDEHPLRFIIEKNSNGLKPYVLVRGRLEALLTRAVMYDLVALGEEIDMDGETMFVVRSNGVIFPIMPVDALEAALQ